MPTLRRWLRHCLAYAPAHPPGEPYRYPVLNSPKCKSLTMTLTTFRVARAVAFSVSVGCFLISLKLPSFFFGEEPEAAIGLSCLLAGWAVCMTEYGVSWLANLLLPPAALLFLFGFLKTSTVFSIGGLVLCLTFLRASEIMITEAGHMDRIVGTGTGY